MVASSLVFAAPWWFTAVPAIAAAAVALWFLARRISKKRIERFASAVCLPEETVKIARKLRFRRFVIVSITAGLMAVALARPLTGPREESDQRKGADLVIALDVSKSMWVTDVQPNRLTAVKEALGEWIQNQKVDRIGLVLFAGEAFVQAPLTFDYTALDFVLQDASPASISKKGTNIPKAIETAVEMMDNNQVESKFLLLVSDGENIEGDAITAAREAYQQAGMRIYTVGVGSASGGKVQSYDKSKHAKPPPNQPEFIKNEYGSEVVSRLDSQALRAIARVAGGSYYDFKPGEPIFQNIREKNVSPIVEKMRKIDAKDFDEWFQVPLGLAILLLALEPLLLRIRERRKSLATGVPVAMPETLSARGTRAAATAAIMLSLVVGWANNTKASPVAIEAAEQLLSDGKNDEAVAVMRQSAEGAPDDPYLNYNFGLTLVRTGRIEEAVSVFENVQSLTSDKKLRAQAMLQLGNIHLQSAIDAKGGASTVRALENALSNYEMHLELRSSEAGTKNRAAAATQLEEVLLKIGAERTKANTEKSLREAMQVYERATELNTKNQPLLDKAKTLLANELAKNAAEIDQQADKAEADKESVAGKQFRGMLERRESALSKLQEASGLQPDRVDLQNAVKEQQSKMSDLLTRSAEEQTKELLDKDRNFYSNNSLKDLQDAGSKLEQAISLNPENQKAEDLKAKVDRSLVNAHLQNGELAMKHFRKKPPENTEGRLSDATSAVKSFSAALELDPENEEAKKGLAEIQPQLAELHAAAGEADLKDAEELLADGAGKGEAEAAPSQEGETALDGISTDTLRKTSTLLEKSINNLNAAAGLDPNNKKHEQSAAKAEGLMESLRDALAKQDAKAGKGAGAAAPGEGSAPGPGGGEGEGQGKSGEGQGTSSLQSLSGLRGKSKSGGGDGGESSRYWEKFVRDW